jgi:hypothetical protein
LSLQLGNAEPANALAQVERQGKLSRNLLDWRIDRLGSMTVILESR